MKDGDEKVSTYLATGMKGINGWTVDSLFGDKAFYNGNWLKRAAAAKAGIYGNDAVEAMYPQLALGADEGQVYRRRSTQLHTHVKCNGQPPVNAFWSVTMYDGNSQLLIKNPINRYLINSPMLPDMNKNPDGSLTVYIQKEPPCKENEANWLPAPDGAIYIVMRLYWPKETPPSILPAGSGTWQPPAVVQNK